MGQGVSGLAGPPSSDGLLLNIAAKEGHSDVAALFLSKNAALAFHTDASQHTPVHYAAQNGNEDILQLLIRTLKASAASNTFDPVQRTLDLADCDGQTALMLACAAGHEAVTKLLLSHGASVWLLDAAGRSCLHHAARRGSSSKCLLIVLAAAAQGMLGDKEQHTLSAPEAKHAELARFVNMPDRYGRTALHHAAWSGDMPGAHALLAGGAVLTAQATTDCYEMDLPCNAGATALHVAALKDHKDVALLLLSAYVRSTVGGGTALDPRAVLDAYGMSPYAISAQRDDDNLTQLLNPRTMITELIDVLPPRAADDTDQIAVAFGRLTQAVDGARGFVRAMTTSSSKGADRAEPASKARPMQQTMRQLDAQDMSSRLSTGATTSSQCTTAEAVELLNGRTSTCQTGCCSHAPTAAHNTVPEAFLCPLTKQNLRDPVVASDGFTYEKAALQKWLQSGNEASPITKKLLPSLQYYPNNTLYLLMETWHASSRHMDDCSADCEDGESAAVAAPDPEAIQHVPVPERGRSEEGSPLLL